MWDAALTLTRILAHFIIIFPMVSLESTKSVFVLPISLQDLSSGISLVDLHKHDRHIRCASFVDGVFVFTILKNYNIYQPWWYCFISFLFLNFLSMNTEHQTITNSDWACCQNHDISVTQSDAMAMEAPNYILPTVLVLSFAIAILFHLNQTLWVESICRRNPKIIAFICLIVIRRGYGYICIFEYCWEFSSLCKSGSSDSSRPVTN